MPNLIQCPDCRRVFEARPKARAIYCLECGQKRKRVRDRERYAQAKAMGTNRVCTQCGHEFQAGPTSTSTVCRTCKAGLRAIEDTLGYKPKPCSAPTDALPGSRLKIMVMHARYMRGEELHHPDDAKGIDSTQSGGHHNRRRR